MQIATIYLYQHILTQLENVTNLRAKLGNIQMLH